jgi:hypothetical protein
MYSKTDASFMPILSWWRERLVEAKTQVDTGGDRSYELDVKARSHDSERTLLF